MSDIYCCISINSSTQSRPTVRFSMPDIYLFECRGWWCRFSTEWFQIFTGLSGVALNDACGWSSYNHWVNRLCIIASSIRYGLVFGIALGPKCYFHRDRQPSCGYDSPESYNCRRHTLKLLHARPSKSVPDPNLRQYTPNYSWHCGSNICIRPRQY